MSFHARQQSMIRAAGSIIRQAATPPAAIFEEITDPASVHPAQFAKTLREAGNRMRRSYAHSQSKATIFRGNSMSLLHAHVVKGVAGAAGFMPLAAYTAVEAAFPTVATPAVETGALFTPHHVLIASGLAAVSSILWTIFQAIWWFIGWRRERRESRGKKTHD